MTDVALWVLIAGLAFVSFFTRGSFILGGRRVQLPMTLERVLRFAPAAALMAVILPDIARSGSGIDLSWHNPRVVAGAVAFAVAAMTRHILGTILAGMLVLTLYRVFG
jgi:branched-subunit amino acid transport protein